MAGEDVLASTLVALTQQVKALVGELKELNEKFEPAIVIKAEKKDA